MKFLDEAKVYIQGGAGGPGCISFRREKFIEYGGPNGGNGGRGGDVWAVCVSNLNTLIDYRYQQHFKAGKGEHGMGQNCHGCKGDDAILKLPIGTQIYAQDKETLLADLRFEGQKVLLLRGGNGGFGNAHFKGSINQAPRHANPGQPALEATIYLRLKLIADAGLVGLPNAGKSTLLSVVSNARPKIADYPFTTLYPNLGVITIGEDNFVLADIPGLIEGASEGSGLGDRFLGHVERCAVLVHLIDATEDNITENYEIIEHELAAYSEILAEKPRLIILNKSDAVDEETLQEKVEALKEASGEDVLVMSGVARHGLKEVLHKVYEFVKEERSMRVEEEKKSPIDRDYIERGYRKKGIVAPYTLQAMEGLLQSYIDEEDEEEEEEDGEDYSGYGTWSK